MSKPLMIGVSVVSSVASVSAHSAGVRFARRVQVGVRGVLVAYLVLFVVGMVTSGAVVLVGVVPVAVCLWLARDRESMAAGATLVLLGCIGFLGGLVSDSAQASGLEVFGTLTVISFLPITLGVLWIVACRIERASAGASLAKGLWASGTRPMPVVRSRHATATPATWVGGVLEIDALSGCITLSGLPTVWPLGTSATREPPAIQLANGLEVRPGDYVEGPGRRYGPDQLLDLNDVVEADDLPRIRSCQHGLRETLVFCAGADELRISRQAAAASSHTHELPT